MFTGIVTEVGRIKDVSRERDILRLTIEAPSTARSSKAGDSVSINGICLTVTAAEKGLVHFDAVSETLRRTSLKTASAGDAVNLEPPLKVGDPLGGHFVTGHVDYVGKVVDIAKGRDEAAMSISLPQEYAGMVAEKGSVAVDGVSLTVGEVRRDSFKVYLIPHTLRSTVLGSRGRGDGVNVEFDIVGRYAARQREVQSRSIITEDFLRSKGF